MSIAAPVSMSHPIDISPANPQRQMGAADDQRLSMSIEQTKHYWDDYRSLAVSQSNAATSQLGYASGSGPGPQPVDHQMDPASEMNQDLEPMKEMAPHSLPQESMASLLATNGEDEITFGTFGTEKDLPQKAEVLPQPSTTGLEILNANANNEMIDTQPESNLNTFMAPSYDQPEANNMFNTKEMDSFEPPMKEDVIEPDRGNMALFDIPTNKVHSRMVPQFSHKPSPIRYPSLVIATHQTARPASLDANQYPLHHRNNEAAFAYHTSDLPSRLIQPTALQSMQFPSGLPEQQGIQYGFSQSTGIPQSPPMLNTQQSLTATQSYLQQSATQQSYSAAFPTAYPSVLSTSISQMVPSQSYMPFGSSRGEYGGGGSVLMKPSSVTKTVASLGYASVPNMTVTGNSLYGQVSDESIVLYPYVVTIPKVFKGQKCQHNGCTTKQNIKQIKVHLSGFTVPIWQCCCYRALKGTEFAQNNNC